VSEKRGSNSRPSAWEADALPTELLSRDWYWQRYVGQSKSQVERLGRNIGLGAGVYLVRMPRRPPSRTILSPASRNVVAGLLIAAGVLLIIGQLLRLYVLLYDWRAFGVLGARPIAGVLLGTGAGVLTSYIGWRVGRAGQA
jgi:hypothetical protein